MSIKLYDETIELLDENEENILLRMLRIGYQNDECVINMLFDSKKRIYITHPNIDISSFYYSSNLRYTHCNIDKLALQITDATYDYLLQYKSIKSKIIRHFYNNRNEYWPTTFRLSNFELK